MEGGSVQAGSRKIRIKVNAFWNPKPTCPDWAEERSVKRKRARDCLSAANSSETPLGVSTARCPERSAGTQAAGRLLFAYFLLAKQKNSRSPAAAIERHQVSTTKLVRDSIKVSTGSTRTGESAEASIPQPERLGVGEWVQGSSYLNANPAPTRPGWAEERSFERVRARTCLSRRRVCA